MIELKDFIKTSVQSIIDATTELQQANSDNDVFVNPATRSTSSGEDRVTYHDAFLPVTEVGFDIAVGEVNEKTGEAGAKIGVALVGAGGKGSVSKSNESQSRITFSLRVALPPEKGPEKGDKIPGRGELALRNG